MTKSWLTVLLLPLFQTAYFLWRAGIVIWVVLSPRALADLMPLEIEPNVSTEPEALIRSIMRMKLRAAFVGSLLGLLTLLCTTYLFYLVLQSEIAKAAPSRGPVFFFIAVVLVFAVCASTMWESSMIRSSNRFYKKSV